MVKLSIGESRPKKFKLLAWLIMKVEGIDHSHSFITWRDHDIDVRKVAEARGSGGRIITNHQFKEENEVVNVYYYYIPEDKMKELEKWIWENMRPYGFKHILGILVMRTCSAIKRIFGCDKRCKNPFKDGTYSQICVELSSRAIQLAKDVDLPGDVEDYGLLEMHDINEEYSEGKADQAKLDKINGKS